MTGHRSELQRIMVHYGLSCFLSSPYYIRVGKEIYKMRRELRSVCQTSSKPHPGKSQVTNKGPYSELAANEPIHSTRTTEVHVISNTRSTEPFPSNGSKGDCVSADAMIKMDRYVVPHLSIGPISELAHFFSAVRQYRQIDQLVPNCHNPNA
jgi:hypothetical protein